MLRLSATGESHFNGNTRVSRNTAHVSLGLFRSLHDQHALAIGNQLGKDLRKVLGYAFEGPLNGFIL